LHLSELFHAHARGHGRGHDLDGFGGVFAEHVGAEDGVAVPVGVFGIGEAPAGHRLIDHLPARAAHGVPGRGAPFEPGALDELGLAVHVPGGEHGLGRRTLDRGAGGEADGELVAAAFEGLDLVPVVPFTPLDQTGPRWSASSIPWWRRWPAMFFLSWAYRATRALLARTASRLGTGRGPSRPKRSQEDQSRASRAPRARVRTGVGPRLMLVPRPARLPAA
jgi:hypothetical protein